MTGDLYYIYEPKELTQVDFLEKNNITFSKKIKVFITYILHFIMYTYILLTTLMLYPILNFE